MALDLSQIDVVEFLSELGLNNVRDEGKDVWYSCFSDEHYRGDANPSASMEKGSTRFYCFSCGMKGNAVTFLSEYENVSPLQASEWIKDRFGGASARPKNKSRLENVKELLNKPNKTIEENRRQILKEEEITKRYIDWKSVDVWRRFSRGQEDKQDAPFFYMLDRGFSPDVLSDWNVGFDRISERISIPVRDTDSHLVGFKGRSYNKEPKYLVLGGPEFGFDPYETSSVLFGLDKVGEKDTLILREGELNTIALHQKGFDNAVGISGKFLSGEQAELLIKYTNHAILWFDDELDAIKAAKKLYKKISVSIVPSYEKDPADMTAEEISEILSTSKSLLQY